MTCELAFGAALLALLVSISVIDFRRGIIPNALVLVLAATGILQALALDYISPWNAALGAIAGGLAFYAIRHLYFLARRTHGLGLGDVKFAAAAGFWVGISGLPFLTLIAALSGLLFAVAQHLAAGDVERQTRISFGPHLAIGLFATWFCKIRGYL